MEILLPIITVTLLGVIIIIQIVQIFRKVSVDLGPTEQALSTVEKSYERVERAVREEIANNREELANLYRQSREELSNTLKGISDTIYRQLGSLTQTTDEKLDQVRQDLTNSSKNLREEIGNTLKGFNDSLVNNMGQMANSQKSYLDVFSERLDKLTQSNEQKLGSMRETVEQRLTAMQEDSGKKLDQMREESSNASQKAREEVTTSMKDVSETLVKTLNDLGLNQRNQLRDVLDQLAKLTGTTETKLEAQKSAIDERLKQIQTESTASAKAMREDVSGSLKNFNDSVLKGMTGMADSQQKQMASFSSQLTGLTESNQQKLDSLKTAVEDKLKSIQEDNAKQLDQMRATVDEKLQGTLEKRLGESFKQVSERLEQVHKGLGEMQLLATGVGDLKKVLTNIKTRGTWGEVQLGVLLEQVLAPDQYAKNVGTKDAGERVEFAIKLPGKNEDHHDIVWLPIDAKFPVEDYQRLIDAQERADAVSSEAAAKQLEIRIKQCANDICKKYLNPPKTTDFGILFLPTEGLFSVVIRRDGLAEYIQR
jgi:DNA recombination protein RmuC